MEGEDYVFMDMGTYETRLTADQIGDSRLSERG